MTEHERNELIASVMGWGVKCFQKFDPIMFRKMGIEEVNQEVWLHLACHAHKYDPSRGKPTTWAFLRVRHLVSMLQRRQNAKKRFCVMLADDAERGVDKNSLLLMMPEKSRELYYGEDEIEQVRAAMNSLAPRNLEVLKMTLDGYTLEEIGGRLNISRERVRQLRLKATARVCEKLRIEVNFKDKKKCPKFPNSRRMVAKCG